MNLREKALEQADVAIERIESGNIAPDTQDMMAYALVLILADISKRLKGITNIMAADSPHYD